MLLPIRIVESSSDGLRIIKAIAFPFGPPSSISCRARSAPIESNAASAAEKNAVAMKHIKRETISIEVVEISNGGSMKGSLFSYDGHNILIT